VRSSDPKLLFQNTSSAKITTAHAINWFEIPSLDFEFAKAFYETVLEVRVVLAFPGMKYAMFPADMQHGEIGGGLVEE
jgi:uncharacterized protein